MVDRRHDRAERSAVTFQLVRDQAKRNLPLTLQELDKEALCGATVTPGLDEDVDHIAVLIDRTSKILPFAIDRHEHFVQKPCISEATLSSSETPDIFETEPSAPPADRFVGHYDSSFGKKILNIPEAEAEFVVEPDGMTDDFAWVTVPVIEGSRGFHHASLPVTGSS